MASGRGQVRRGLGARLPGLGFKVMVGVSMALLHQIHQERQHLLVLLFHSVALRVYLQNSAATHISARDEVSTAACEAVTAPTKTSVTFERSAEKCYLSWLKDDERRAVDMRAPAPTGVHVLARRSCGDSLGDPPRQGFSIEAISAAAWSPKVGSGCSTHEQRVILYNKRLGT